MWPSYTGRALAHRWNRGCSTFQQKDRRKERERKAQTRDTWDTSCLGVQKKVAMEWELRCDPEDVTRLRVCMGHATQD